MPSRHRTRPDARAKSLRLVDLARRIAAHRKPHPRPDEPDAILPDRPPRPRPLVGGAAAPIDGSPARNDPHSR